MVQKTEKPPFLDVSKQRHPVLNSKYVTCVFTGNRPGPWWRQLMIWNGCQGAGFGTVGGLLEPKLMEGRKRNSFNLGKTGRNMDGLPPGFLEKNEKSHRKK